MIIINFKNYKQGREVLKLSKKVEKYIPKAIVAVPPMYLGFVSFRTKLKVYAQHVDYQSSDKTTGFTLARSIKKSGAKGTLLNHSEHKIKSEEIKKTIKECEKLKLKVIACASNLREAKEIKKFKPFAVAFEDPKLISTGKSITKYRTNDLKKFISLFKKTKIIPLCGAGINSKEDILEAKKLGCKGVLVSSAVANSKNPERFLNNVSRV